MTFFGSAHLAVVVTVHIRPARAFKVTINAALIIAARRCSQLNLDLITAAVTGHGNVGVTSHD